MHGLKPSEAISIWTCKRPMQVIEKQTGQVLQFCVHWQLVSEVRKHLQQKCCIVFHFNLAEGCHSHVV